MSTIKADAITTKSDNTDLSITGHGSGVPDLEAGFKVGGSVGVPASAIAADAIDGTKIADNAIDSEHYTDGSIDNAHIADDAIDSEHYAAGSIDEAHIADDQVTLAKMAAGTDGVIITYDASGNPAHVGPGSDGEVLTSTGAGSPPAFEAAGGGAWTFINKTTVAAASLFTITGFTNTYDHHVLVIPGCQASDSLYQIQLSTDGGTSYETGSNYAYTIQVNAANSGSFSTERGTAATQWEIGRGLRAVYPIAWIAEIHLFGMAQTVYYTTYQGLWSGGGTSSQVTKGGPMLGCMLTTGAWDALKIFNATYTGDVYLYGVSQS